MLVAFDLVPTLGTVTEDESDSDGDDPSIWPSPKKPCLLPSPWQSFPLDLLFQSVLVRLPFPVLLKFRSVSRSWCQRLSSHNFWLLWFQGIANPIHNSNPNFGSYSVQRCNPYHVLDRITLASNRRVPCLLLCSALPKATPGCAAAHWLHRFAVHFALQQNGAAAARRQLQCWFQLHESFMNLQDPYILLASDGGLLLLVTRSEQYHKLVVCNPLLRAHKVIHTFVCSPSADMPYKAVGFVVDKLCGEYRVSLYGKSCHIYSSSTNIWQPIPTDLPKDASSPPILEGSHFWLSYRQESSHEATLFTYHANADVVTRMQTRFPVMVSFPRVSSSNCGLVWKESNSLHTLAWRSSTPCVWKLDNGLWMYKEGLSMNLMESEFSAACGYVKVDDLLLFRWPYSMEICVFNCELKQCRRTPCCSAAESITGHCVFIPSCIRV